MPQSFGHPSFTCAVNCFGTCGVYLIGMAGLNPLRGPNLDEFGPRFPDMSQAYDHQLGILAHEVADEAAIRLHAGVYVCLAGPSFESPADLRFLRGAGADAVGMSTVPEVIVARHGGMRILGISGISKGGWHHLWVLYADDVDQNTFIKRPVAAYVERVYNAGDFSQLGVGT